MRMKHALGVTAALVAGLLAAPVVAAPAYAAVGEDVRGTVVIGGTRIPGENTLPFWSPGVVYKEGDRISFNDSDYRLTAAGAAAYEEFRPYFRSDGKSFQWSLAPERFRTIDGTIVQYDYQASAWEYIGPSTRKGAYLGEFTFGSHLYYNVNDTTTYNGHTYIATQWSLDVYPTDRAYFDLVK